MNMLKSIFVLVLGMLITFPNQSIASYYAQDYDPSYLPYNFQEAVDADYSGCNTVLDQYDDGYWQLDEKFEALRKGTAYNGPVWMPIGKQSAFNLDQLRTYTEEEIRLCLIDYREYEEKQAQEAEERAIAERQAEVQKAVTNCDFVFFEKMTSAEKMQTFDEREACKNKTVSTPAPVSTPTPTPIPVVTPTIQNTPTSIPQVVSTQQSTDNQAEQVQNTSETTSISATGTSTTTPENIETPPQDQVTEDQEGNSEPETQPEQKPSVFKRVINFLFGWLW